MAETDRILGYFLDEAQEHLRTIEEGLILPMSLAEPAKIKEVFRAAHSIKGGAAMLGLEVVLQLGNHFEQAFKAIKDRSIPVDDKLQDLLLEGLEILRLSIQMVQHGQTVPTDLLKEAVFAKIAKRIQKSGGEITTDDSDLPFTDPAIEQVFGNYVNQKLQQFVDICKKTQPEAITKQELQPICQKIGSLGESFEYLAWTNLLISCRLAVNNPLNSVVQLREVIPTAIHQAQMLVMAGKHHAITSTPELEILLAPNAITNTTRTQTGLSAYDTLDSISGVWDDVVINEDESSDFPAEKPQPTSADFLFEPQMVSTETISDDDFGDSELDEFMQLFDEELSFDGTWVQNEDILTHEDPPTGYAEPDVSKNLWDEDIATRPISSNSLMPMESPFSKTETIGQQLPQFDFEQVSDSDLFIEDVTDTAVKPSPIRPTAAIDWSGLLADIPDQVIVEYKEPSQPPPDLPSAMEKVPIGLTNNDFFGDLPANLPAQINPNQINHDDNFSDPFASDPFLSDFSDLPFGLDLEDPLEAAISPDIPPPLEPLFIPPIDPLITETETTASDFNDPFLIDELLDDEPLVMESDDELDDLINELSEPFEVKASVFSPPDHPQLKPIDADYLKELAMFDDLLADTKTTDVDLADLEQMIANGNLEEELDLENIEDFSPASVNSKVNSKLLINFDDFLTEAKTTVNNTTNSNHFPDSQPAHAGTEHSTVMTAPAAIEAEAAMSSSAATFATERTATFSTERSATFATERAATEADLGLEDLDLLDLKSIDNLDDLNYELDDVLAGLNMLDISDDELPSGSLTDLLDKDFEFGDLDSGSLNLDNSVVSEDIDLEDELDLETTDRSTELTGSISELFMDDFDESHYPINNHPQPENNLSITPLYSQDNPDDLISLSLSDMDLESELEPVTNQPADSDFLSLLDGDDQSSISVASSVASNEAAEAMDFDSFDLDFNNQETVDESQFGGNVDELASLDLVGVDFDSISADQSSAANLDLGEPDRNFDGLDINSDLEMNADLAGLDLNELDGDLDGLDINSDLEMNDDLVGLDLNELDGDLDGLDINSDPEMNDDLVGLDLDDLDSNLDGLDINSDLEMNADLVGLDLDDLDSNLDGLDDLLGTPATSSLTDLDGLLAEESFGDLDAFLTVPPVDLPTVAIATAAVAGGIGAAIASIPATPQPVSDRKVAAPAAAKNSRSKQRTFEQTMRVSVKNLNNLNNLTGELVVNRNTLEQDQNRMRQFIDKLLLEVQKLNEVGKSMQDLYEKSLLESSLLASRQQSQQAKSMVPGSSTGGNNSGDAEYDPLEMDKFTPVHLISQQMIELTVRIRESTSDIEFVVDSSTEVTRSLRQITSQLQEDLNKSRMLPFSQTSDRLQRGVRDNGLKYGKEVDLQVEGSDTLIDKVILENLNDPLIHMVNNAIAHGIESPAERLAAGKPAEGVITISATHQGTQTIISVKDDGAGIDADRVKNKAIEKGIITPARAVTMTKQEVYELLFLPSFSTKDQADELAGRGVGMDVVLSSLQEIRGTITTESKLGTGTTFTIRLPLALSITKALMASNKDVGIAFPMDGIEDSLSVKPYSIIESADGQKFFPWRDQQMPFRPLSDLLAFNRPMKRVNYYGGGIEETEQSISIIVLRSGGDLVAIEVDRVLGEQEIVIKPLQGPAPKPLGIAGATVLGDGRIIPIADVLELVDLASGKLEKNVNQTWSMGDIPEDQAAQREPMVLVVDDSITVRQLLSLTFTKAGYRVEQARDGQEAWDKLRAGLPCDIIFCDIEMPRMDGLELLSKVQADEVIRKIPMAMLTSRGSDRHRQIASQLGASGYFIKPYLEDALLEAVKRMLKGEVLAIV
jgi:chemotaxis protein histidine kinase CheA/CheY-like chemotaxis protein